MYSEEIRELIQQSLEETLKENNRYEKYLEMTPEDQEKEFKSHVVMLEQLTRTPMPRIHTQICEECGHKWEGSAELSAFIREDGSELPFHKVTCPECGDEQHLIVSI